MYKTKAVLLVEKLLFEKYLAGVEFRPVDLEIHVSTPLPSDYNLFEIFKERIPLQENAKILVVMRVVRTENGYEISFNYQGVAIFRSKKFVLSGNSLREIYPLVVAKVKIDLYPYLIPAEMVSKMDKLSRQLFEQAKELKKAGKLEESRDKMFDVVSINPYYPDALLFLVELYPDNLAYQNSYYSKYLDLRPNDYRVRYLFAKNLMQSEDYSLAQKHLEKILRYRDAKKLLAECASHLTNHFGANIGK